MRLWQTERETEDEILKLVEQFTVGDDWQIDQRLLRWDICASSAHAQMLKTIGVLTSEELISLRAALNKADLQAQKGEFIILRADEDCHTALENFLVTECGEAGKKIHTGRSRNDQVLAAMRLAMKYEGFNLAKSALELAASLHAVAVKYPMAPMPGYTHMQKAMPSTWELWAGAHVAGIVDSVNLILGVLQLIDTSPLGSAAGYGVSLPLNREIVAETLGFSAVQSNVLAVQNSRGKFEAVLAGGAASLMIDLSKLAADLLFYTQDELAFVRLDSRFCTGSSIMPQKKNPDVLELLRARSHRVLALQQELWTTINGLPSGYHRDFQQTKGSFFSLIDLVSSAVKILTPLIATMEVDLERSRQGCDISILLTDKVYELVSAGLPFRDAYRQVKSEYSQQDKTPPLPKELDLLLAKAIVTKSSNGAPGNPGTEQLGNKLMNLHKKVEENLFSLLGRFERI